MTRCDQRFKVPHVDRAVAGVVELDRLLVDQQVRGCSGGIADYAAQGMLKGSLKDARLMLEMGAKLGAPLLMTSLYAQIMQAAFEKGFGEKDTVAFYEILRVMAGLEERSGSHDGSAGKP